VLAAPLRADRDGGPGAPWPGRQRPGAGQPREAQHLGGGVAELGQVIECFPRDLPAIGLADGQGQPGHEAGSPPPRRGQAALGGQGDRDLSQALVAGQLPVPDAARVGGGELAAHAEKQELPGDGGKADPLVVNRAGRGDAQLVEQGPGPGAVGGPAALRPVQGCALGRRSPGRISMSCDGWPPDWRATHSGSCSRMFSRQSRHSPSVLTLLSCPHLRHGAVPGCRWRQVEQAVQSANWVFSPQPRQTRHCPTGHDRVMLVRRQ
jgi:hypothetical protein